MLCFFTQRMFQDFERKQRMKTHCHFLDWTQLCLKNYFSFIIDSFFIYLLHGKV